MAHGQRAELAFYGDFGPQAARCQRVIARAAAQCVAAVVTVRATSLAEQVQGQPCDGAAADAAADAARQRARAEIQTARSAQDAGMVQFVRVSEGQIDVSNVCGQMETVAVSAVYGPALSSGSVGSVEGNVRSCMLVTAARVARLLRFSAAARQAAFDRIAAG